MSNSNKGLPGLRGTDHIGFTVPNLEEAVDFFVNVIGCEPFFELGPFEVPGEWMEEHLGVDRRAVMKKIKFLRCQNGSNYELFEYESPDQNKQQPKNSDIGGHHLALYVEDIDAAIDYLKSKGVEMMGEPTVRTAGYTAGQTWVYFRTPWGMQMELVSSPNGRAYEKEYDGRLWHPKFPDQ